MRVCVEVRAAMQVALGITLFLWYIMVRRGYLRKVARYGGWLGERGGRGAVCRLCRGLPTNGSDLPYGCNKDNAKLLSHHCKAVRGGAAVISFARYYQCTVQ